MISTRKVVGVQTDGTDRELRGELGYRKDRSKASLLCLFRASLIQGCPEKSDNY